VWRRGRLCAEHNEVESGGLDVCGQPFASRCVHHGAQGMSRAAAGRAFLPQRPAAFSGVEPGRPLRATDIWIRIVGTRCPRRVPGVG